MAIKDFPSTPVPSVAGQSGRYLTTNGTSISWGAINTSSLTLLSTTSFSGTSTTVSNIDQSFTDLLVIVRSPRWQTADDVFIILPNNASQAFYSGVVENTNGGYSATGAGDDAIYGLISESRTSFDKGYALLIRQYSGSNTFTKPFNYHGTTVSGDQRSWNFAGGLRIDGPITSMVFRTANSRTFETTNPGQVLIYGVR